MKNTSTGPDVFVSFGIVPKERCTEKVLISTQPNKHYEMMLGFGSFKSENKTAGIGRGVNRTHCWLGAGENKWNIRRSSCTSVWGRLLTASTRSWLWLYAAIVKCLSIYWSNLSSNNESVYRVCRSTAQTGEVKFNLLCGYIMSISRLFS